MIDLAGIIKSNDDSQKESNTAGLASTVLFRQTTECIELVTEAFRFEGIPLPTIVDNSDRNIKDFVQNSKFELVIVELTTTLDVVSNMERISHLLPNDTSVIVIGNEDAISTIRHLKQIGFYYILWPISKRELIYFVKNVYENRHRKSGLGKDRTAKRIALWGTKGGVGTTMLTAEIAHELSKVKKSSCLVVDHDSLGGNIDIFLFDKNFQKKIVSTEVLTADLDISYANSMVKKLDDMLSVLAIESNDLDESALKTYVRSLSNILATEYNFIIEDYSRSSCSKNDLKYISEQNDIIVVVLEPTVSSAREAKRTLQSINHIDSKVRCVFVLNYTMPANSATISQEEINKFLNIDVDIIIPHEVKFGGIVLEGEQHLFQSKLPISRNLNNLTSLLLGEQRKNIKPSMMDRFFRRRS
ncbi:AAA family ATPase [Vibrio splendidus]|uniref:AAA family ATPase n=1 Tax=Vibrio splendidus TaxID=29497 RepID=UPI000C82F2D2|nr:chromosome partitioning protein ParA [Vibrio splendidus]PMI52579.1 chromosome partitioning protein ParA [Vibrio splendidus]PMI77960.1 chromosome partitioning protein ParA [Vibrio splendidus]